MKYRILQNKNGKYKVRIFFFWFFYYTLEYLGTDFDIHPYYYNSFELAKEAAEEELEKRQHNLRDRKCLIVNG